jgi:hypothetical protein
MELKLAMHIARNPSGFNDIEIRDARQEVCDEVERLERLLRRAWTHHTAQSTPLVVQRFGGMEKYIEETVALWQHEIPERLEIK